MTNAGSSQLRETIATAQGEGSHSMLLEEECGPSCFWQPSYDHEETGYGMAGWRKLGSPMMHLSP